VQRAGPRLGLLVADLTVVEGITLDEALRQMEDAHVAFGIGLSDLSQRYGQPLPDADAATISAVAERLLQAGARDLYAEGVDPGEYRPQFRITVGRGQRGLLGWRRPGAWLPLGARSDVALSGASVTSTGGGKIRIAFGEPAPGVPGFRRTHQRALSAQAVALAAGPAGRPVTSFGEVAPLALMSDSLELLRDWVTETLGPLADDDDHNARLRDTLQVFLQENGSHKTAAERLTLHRNTVQYRVRKAEESLKHPIDQDRLRIELALLAAQWLGSSVLRPVRGSP
jgi:PucR C-terminal helix-turn-helix domain